MNELDLVINGGTCFDGTGAPGAVANVGVKDGAVAAVSRDPLPVGPDTRTVDATGQWVMPGFVDAHTHYDAELLSDEAYRRWFRRDFDRRFSPRVWHRDFDDAEITECPDASLVGLMIGDVARQRKLHPADCYLDLVVEHGQKLRWKTNVANTRPEVQDKLINRPGIRIGFSDAARTCATWRSTTSASAC
jgi:N-acyl-D-aspartate/D-glutamate deacylase